MSKDEFGSIYVAEGHVMYLVPDFTVGMRKITITGAGVYNRSKEYLGYWDRHNMPHPVIQQLTKWAHTYRNGEISRRRNAIAKNPSLRWLKD